MKKWGSLDVAGRAGQHRKPAADRIGRPTKQRSRNQNGCAARSADKNVGVAGLEARSTRAMRSSRAAKNLKGCNKGGWGLTFWVDDEGGDDAGGGRETGSAGGKPARTAVYFAQVGVRVHIHLHFTELQVAECHQRKRGTHRIYALLHHVGRTHGLLDGAVPSARIHFPAEVAVLVAVIVVGLERQALAVPRDEFQQIHGLIVIGGFRRSE